ncbi:MAG: MFS transporter [Candidatus Micrarchaeia archaeon]
MNPHENIILGILILGTLMGAIDTTIVLLSLPAITEGLHSSLAITIWVILAYLLVIAIMSTQFGRLGDIFGRSRMFNLGFAVFTIGSLLCGLSITDMYLVGFRIVQAVGGALMQATSGAIIADTFEVGRRGRAYGYTAMGWNIGGMLGILLGGVITTFIGWRYIFFINVPIGIVAFALGIKYLTDNPKVEAKTDIIGMVILGLALLLISYAAIDFASFGLRLLNIVLLLVGAALVPLFLVYEKRNASPMIKLEAFKDKVLRNSLFASFFQSLGFLSVAFIIIMYLQGIRGLDPFAASLLLVPGYIVSSFVAPFMGKLSDRFGARIMATLGVGFMAVAVLVYLSIGLSSPYYIIIVASLITGLGGSLFWPANSSAVMSSAPHEHYGSTSGLLRLMSNIGTLGSFVIAITAATAAIPRNVAFSVFIGTSKLIGGVSSAFLGGVHAALVVCLAILFIAGVLSATRGKEYRQKANEIARREQRGSASSA